MGCSERNVCASALGYPGGQKATVRTEHGEAEWFPIGDSITQGCILTPYMFNLYAEHHTKKTQTKTKNWARLKKEYKLVKEISIM